MPRTTTVASAAVSQLLRGPHGRGASDRPYHCLAVRRERPRHPLVNGLARGLARPGDPQLDPEAELAALAQLTFTLTQFPTVTGVEFWSGDARIARVDGSGVDFTRPVTRAAFEALTPAIFIESPCIGDSVGSPLVVSGTANTFEATFIVELIDDERRHARQADGHRHLGQRHARHVQVSIPFATSAGGGTLVAYEVSAEDGSHINEVRVPLSLAP